jgi:hypothetical protein
MDIELHPLPSSINQDSDEGTNHDSSDGWTDEYTDEETTVNADESLNDDSADGTDDAGGMDDSTDEDTDEDTDDDTDGDVDDHTSHYPRFLAKPRSKLCCRLKGVKLRIKDRGLERGDSISGASPQWLKLVNKFSNLKSLALHFHADKLSLDNVRGRSRGSIEY